jgi:hypothetical protein
MIVLAATEGLPVVSRNDSLRDDSTFTAEDVVREAVLGVLCLRQVSAEGECRCFA